MSKDTVVVDVTPEKEEGNLSKDHSISLDRSRNALSSMQKGVPIAGFEELPMSIIALPYVVLVQANTDVYLKDGKTPAPKGTFYFTDTQETTEEIRFVPLRALTREKTVMGDDGKEQIRTKLYCLSLNLEDFEPFILVLPITSFTNWGKMIAQMKKAGTKNSYEHEIVGKIQKTANQKGNKFYIADFVIGQKFEKDDLEVIEQKLAEYGGALDRRTTEADVDPY